MGVLRSNWVNRPMLKQRLITALILIPLVILMLCYANTWVLMGFVGVVMGLLAWEWTGLIPIKGEAFRQHLLKISYGVFCLFCGWAMVWLLPYLREVVLLVWAGIACAIVVYPRHRQVWEKSVCIAILGAWILGGFSGGFWCLYHSTHGLALIFYMLFLVWAVDSGAYFVGKLYGKNRLIPAVSPGKTREGLLGGLGCAMLVALIGDVYFSPDSTLIWLLQALVLAGLAVVGDLFISMLKRRVAIKDTGQIFPGHGGILDRLDSLIAVVPWGYYFYQGWT